MSNELKHLAIIMDGNGRWATKRNRERSYGHRKGAENMKNLAIQASKLNIKVLTLYAFSTENWNRSKKEVNYLMKLPGIFFDMYMKEIMAANIRVDFIGFLDELPKATKNSIDKAREMSKNNSGMILNLAVNYGSQQEIVNAVKLYTDEVVNNKRNNDLSVDQFADYLFTKDYPPVDLLIRTSGELRLSNFLLWQISYAELYFTDVYFPDFDQEQLKLALKEYQERHRRYGG